jgi:hypothetical protein
MQASFKVQFNGKFRRFSLEEITFEALVKQISKKFGLERSVFVVSYLDEEGDRINMSSSFELNEAIQYALPAKCLKLLVDVPSIAESVSSPIAQVVQEVPALVPQVIQEEVIEAIKQNDPVSNTFELLVEKKLQRKQRVRKVRAPRVPKSLKREKTLKPKKSGENKEVTKAPRSIKNKMARVPRQFMARVIAHVNYPTGQEIAPNVDIVKVWKLRNTGTLPWTTEFKVVRVTKNENALLNASESFVLDREVAPGSEYEINIPLRTSNQPGTYESAWRLVNGEGKRFGQRFSCKMIVADDNLTSAQEDVAIVDKKAISIERKQRRAEKLAKYDAQLSQIKSLGMKATGRHVRLLEKFEGNVDQVVAFVNKKNAARLA